VNGDGLADIVVGAPGFDDLGLYDRGRVLLYLGPLTGSRVDPVWTFDGDQAGARLGYSVAGAGDVDADGFADIIVGAPFSDSGRVLVFHGSATGPAFAPDWSARSTQSPAEIGAAVAGAGDVDGDGYADVVVGAPKLGDASQPAEGQIRVFTGGLHGLAQGWAWSAEGQQANALLGVAVAGAGDVNGDGLADVVAGGTGFDDPAIFNIQVGAVLVYQEGVVPRDGTCDGFDDDGD
jgi:hypothetical protein